MIRIEKDTYTATTDYVIIGTHRISANLLRSVLFLWLFFIIAFFTYTIGKADAYQNFTTTAYICKGNLTDKQTGEKIDCSPIYDKMTNQIEWACTNYTEAG